MCIRSDTSCHLSRRTSNYDHGDNAFIFYLVWVIMTPTSLQQLDKVGIVTEYTIHHERQHLAHNELLYNCEDPWSRNFAPLTNTLNLHPQLLSLMTFYFVSRLPYRRATQKWNEGVHYTHQTSPFLIVKLMLLNSVRFHQASPHRLH